MKRERKKGRREAAANPWLVQSKGVAAGLLMMALMLAVGAVVITMALLPEMGMDGWVLASCGGGTLLGSVVAVNAARKRSAFYTLGTSMLLGLVLGVLGFVFCDGLEIGWGVAVFCACLCGGGIAWVLMRGKKK